MKDTLDDRYVRADDYASRVDSLEFSNQVWSVFGQFTQPRSGAEIVSALRLAPEAVQTALRRLVDSKLIHKQAAGSAKAGSAAKAAPAAAKPAPVSAKAAPATAPAAKPAAKAPAGAAPAAGKQVVTLGPAAAPTAAVVSLRLASERALQSPKAPLVNLKLGGPAVAVEPCAPWKLRPILDAIGAHAGGGVAGQLLVYKVFLQLPPDLLKAAGLESLSVVDDKFTVTHPSLRPALVEAARRHANFDITPLLAA